MKTKKKITSRAITFILALVMVLALIPAIPASAAGANPWTGRWSEREPWGGNPGEDFCFWQEGDKVVGTYGSYGNDRFEGTVDGNTLTGTITTGYGVFDNAVFTMSADGNITGTYQYQTYGKKENFKLTKVLDYSEITAKYESGSAISWTGLWHITSYSYGSTMMVQSGDKVTGFIGYNGLFEGTVSGNVLTAHFLPDQKVGSHVTYVFTMSKDGKSLSAYNYYGNSSTDPKDGERISPITYVTAVLNASDWAKTELDKAQAYGLIPDSLIKEDLTKPITRKEFAAVAVKLYENLTGKKAVAATKNPFTDTSDTEILKAVNLGVTNGTSADKFSPNDLLNRQQAATMLTRTLKAAYIPGWTLDDDGKYTLNFTQPAKFADDAKIDDWAKQSVYFMAANKIITGFEDNTFRPKSTPNTNEAINYANATREQALIIATRTVENLKGKTLDYTGGGTTAIPPATSGDLTLADIKKAAQNAEFDVEDGTWFVDGYENPRNKPVDGIWLKPKSGNPFYGILDNDKILVMEFKSAADAEAYVVGRKDDMSASKTAVMASYGKFYVEFFLKDAALNTPETLAKLVALLFA